MGTNPKDNAETLIESQPECPRVPPKKWGHLPDLDRCMGRSDDLAAVYGEHIDVTAQVLAAAMADIWEITPLQDKNGFGRAVGNSWMVNDWCLSDYRMPPALFKLDTRHTRAGGSNVVIERWVDGDEIGVREDGEVVRNSAGSMCFFRQMQGVESVCTRRRVQALSLPRKKLGLAIDEPVLLPDVSQTTAIGQLVFSEWDDLYSDLMSGTGRLSENKMDRLIACLQIAIGVHPQREDVRNHARDALFRRICQYIEQNLETPHLSTESLLHKFGVSRATLYRMFEPFGGVRAYLTFRRAASALFFISDGEGRRGFVQEACDRWGFSSPANFNRTINRLFGNSPKALLPGHSGVDRDSMSLTQFIHDYLGVAYNGAIVELPDLAA